MLANSKERYKLIEESIKRTKQQHLKSFIKKHIYSFFFFLAEKQYIFMVHSYEKGYEIMLILE